MDYLNKQFGSISDCELPATDGQICATNARHHIKVYMRDMTHKFGYELFVLFGDMGFAHKIGQEK